MDQKLKTKSKSDNMSDKISIEFDSLVKKIPNIGYDWHKKELIKNANLNKKFIGRNIQEIPEISKIKKDSCIIISAGPSIHKQQSIKKILDSNYTGTTIAVDGSYVSCIKAGLFPDFVITMDPHPTRVVRWFGDPDFEKHTINDDYFTRQDLDLDFREDSVLHNKEIINLVDKNSQKSKLIISSTSSSTVTKRVIDTNFKDIFWYNPLVDDPEKKNSITRNLWELNKLPCINTGGTVGTVAWLIAASNLKFESIGLVGMDFGYHNEIPFDETQTYYELIDYVGSNIDFEKYFLFTENPVNGLKYYTDPTYYWYKKNFLDIVGRIPNAKTYNCTDGGTLVESPITLVKLDEFLLKFKKNNLD